VAGHGWICEDEGGYAYAETSTGFILVTLMETDTAIGEGLYSAAVTTGDPSSKTTKELLDDIEASLCGTADCEADGTVYILAR
jgi:hypothetical protein